MRILYVTPYVPNQIRVRPFQLLRTLVQRGHDVTLGTVWTSRQEQAELEALRAMGMRVVARSLPSYRSLFNGLGALPTATPLQAVYSWHAGLAALLAQLLRETPVDVIHVEHLRGARYGLALQASSAQAGCPVPVVWDSVDCISYLFRQAAERSSSRQKRWLTKFELGRTRRYEPWLVSRFDRTVVTSSADKQALLDLQAEADKITDKIAGKTADKIEDKIEVVPNGVDLEYFAPVCAPRQNSTVVMSGKMSYHANVTAAHYLVEEIMPLVWVQRPDVQVWLVGKDPPRSVQALVDGPGVAGRVRVTGMVPDVRDFLQYTTLAVAPILYGAGIQNKVLEAMACGAPVVASPQAVSALDVTPGHELLVAQDKTSFAQAIRMLLDDPAQRRRLGEAGRAFVECRHSWSASVARLEAVYAAAGAQTAVPVASLRRSSLV